MFFQYTMIHRLDILNPNGKTEKISKERKTKTTLKPIRADIKLYSST